VWASEHWAVWLPHLDLAFPTRCAASASAWDIDHGRTGIEFEGMWEGVLEKLGDVEVMKVVITW
jgi:hypothetical protein